MFEVEVKNFQSIEKATLKVAGFTALVGRSNIGKSALVRAVRAALTGAPVGSCVRHGKACLRRTKKQKACKCFCSVHIRGNEFDLLWEKGDSINRYTFNGAIYDRTSIGTLEFLPVGYQPVKLADKPVLLQVSDQFSPIFLLDQSGNAVADMLSDVARLDRINIAVRMVEKDRREASSLRKVREKDVLTLQAKLDGFAGLDDAVALTEKVGQDLEKIERTGAKVTQMTEFLARGNAIGARLKVLEKVQTLQIPESKNLLGVQQNLVKLGDWLEDQERLERSVEKLAGVNGIVAPSPGKVKENAATLLQLVGWHQQLVGFKDLFNNMKPVEAIRPFDKDAVRQAEDRYQTVAKLEARFVRLSAAVASLETQYASVLEEEKAAHEEMEALGVCPTCVRPLGAA